MYLSKWEHLNLTCRDMNRHEPVRGHGTSEYIIGPFFILMGTGEEVNPLCACIRPPLLDPSSTGLMDNGNGR